MQRLDLLAHHKRVSGDWAIGGRERRSHYLPNSRTSYEERQTETHTGTCGRCSVSARAPVSGSVLVRVEDCYSVNKTAHKSLSERWAVVCMGLRLPLKSLSVS